MVAGEVLKSDCILDVLKLKLTRSHLRLDMGTLVVLFIIKIILLSYDFYTTQFIALLIQFSDIFVYLQNCITVTTSIEFGGFCLFIYLFLPSSMGDPVPPALALTTEPPGKSQYFSSLLMLLQSTTDFKQHKLI